MMPYKCIYQKKATHLLGGGSLVSCLFCLNYHPFPPRKPYTIIILTTTIVTAAILRILYMLRLFTEDVSYYEYTPAILNKQRTFANRPKNFRSGGYMIVDLRSAIFSL